MASPFDAIRASAGQTASEHTRALDPATAAGSVDFSAIREAAKIKEAEPARGFEEGEKARAELKQVWEAAKEWAQTPEGQRALLETAGGIGLEVGAAVVNPPGALIRLIGRAAYTLWPMLAASFGGAGGSLVAEQVDPSANPAEAAVKAGGEAFMGSGGGRAVVRTAQGRPFSGALKEGAEETQSILSKNVDSTGEPILVSPRMVSNSKSLTFAEDVAQGAIVSARLEKRKGKTIENAIKGYEQFVESFLQRGGNREDAANMVVDAIDEASDIWRATGRGLADKVDKLAPNRAVINMNTPVSIATRMIDPKTGKPAMKTVQTTMKKWAQTQLDEAEGGLGDAGTIRIAQKILDKPDQISFRDAQILRSDLLGAGRQGGGDSGIEVIGKAQGAAKTLANAMDKTMEKSVLDLNNLFRANGAQPKGDELMAAWRTLNTHWKEGRDTFNHKLVKAIANIEPEAVVKRFIKPKAFSSIRRIRNMVDNKEVWGNIQGFYLKDAMETSVVNGQLSGKAMLRKFRQMGDEAMNELFPDKAHLAQVKAWAKALDTAQESMKPGTGSTLIKLSQGGAIAVALGAGGASPEAASAAAFILLAPWAFNRVLSNPGWAKLLTVGLKAPRGSKAAAGAMGQLLAQLNAHGLLESVTSVNPRAKQDFFDQSRAGVDKFAGAATEKRAAQAAQNRAEVTRAVAAPGGREAGVIAPPLRLR